ncbi:MAG: hypothetical protein AAGA68_19205 [Pseudomonadota bacterium]
MSNHRKSRRSAVVATLAVAGAALGLTSFASVASAHDRVHGRISPSYAYDNYRYDYGDRVDRQLDRRALRAANNGNYRRATRLDARGDRFDRYWDARRGRYYTYRWDCGQRIRVWL